MADLDNDYNSSDVEFGSVESKNKHNCDQQSILEIIEPAAEQSSQ